MTNKERTLAVFENYKIRVKTQDGLELSTICRQLKKQESESVTKCHRLKLEAADGKKYKYYNLRDGVKR